jgi:hypothetical protein
MQDYVSVPYNFMWKFKIPLRVKTFLWQLFRKNTKDLSVSFHWIEFEKKSILTKDVLLKRGKCTKNCLFCGHEESINHLFFSCPLAHTFGILWVVQLDLGVSLTVLKTALMFGWEVLGKIKRIRYQWELLRFCGGFENKESSVLWTQMACRANCGLA